MENKRGITLIALVITIIVLIILAGVSISLILGNNGIITKAKQGKQNYQEASVLEKVEMALVEYNTDKLLNGEEAEIEEALYKLLENETFKEIEPEDNIGIVDNYEIVLEKVNNEIVIKETAKIVEGATNVRVSINPREYTKESVEIVLTARGNIQKVIMPNKEEKVALNEKIKANYTVNQNGTYTFGIVDTEGNQEERKVEVNKIDKLKPKDFTIATENITETGFSITAQTDDMEATAEYACSGIERYEYYIKDYLASETTEYTKYTENTITGLEKGIYRIYVIAYDEAGNWTKSNETNVILGDYIYNNGDECTDITGGWEQTGTAINGGTATKEAGFLKLHANNEGRVYMGTKKSMDLSQYRKMIIFYRGGISCVFVGSQKYNSSNPTGEATWRNAKALAGDGFDIIDIGNYNTGYFHLTGAGGTFYVYAIAFI